jgi:very-short-patch-repair endonuclease
MMTDKSVLFLHYWKIGKLSIWMEGLPEPVSEYRFDPDRRWRFDFAWVEQKVAVEIDGNAWNVKGGGRHMQDGDLEKHNAAVAEGWRVFRFSPGMLEKDPNACLEMVRKMVEREN